MEEVGIEIKEHELFDADSVSFEWQFKNDIKKEIETLLSLGLDKEDYEKIFRQNKKKVYSIKTE